MKSLINGKLLSKIKKVKLPTDIIELVHIIDTGEMPRLSGLLKYDFRSVDYLMFGIGAGIFGLWFSWTTVLIAAKHDMASVWLTGIFACIGLLYSVNNLILFTEAKKGRAYVLLTDKYLLVREGKSIKYYLWSEIYCLKIVGIKGLNEGISWDKIRFFYKKNINIVLSFHHLASKSKLFLAEQINRYWHRFGGEAVLVSGVVMDSIKKTDKE